MRSKSEAQLDGVGAWQLEPAGAGPTHEPASQMADSHSFALEHASPGPRQAAHRPSTHVCLVMQCWSTSQAASSPPAGLQRLSTQPTPSHCAELSHVWPSARKRSHRPASVQKSPSIQSPSSLSRQSQRWPSWARRMQRDSEPTTAHVEVGPQSWKKLQPDWSHGSPGASVPSTKRGPPRGEVGSNVQSPL